MVRRLNGLPLSAISVPAGLTTAVMMFPLYLLVLISTRPGLLSLAFVLLLLAHPLAVTAARTVTAHAASRRLRLVIRVSEATESRSRGADVALRVLGKVLTIRPVYLDRLEPPRLQPRALGRAGRAGDLPGHALVGQPVVVVTAVDVPRLLDPGLGRLDLDHLPAHGVVGDQHVRGRGRVQRGRADRERRRRRGRGHRLAGEDARREQRDADRRGPHRVMANCGNGTVQLEFPVHRCLPSQPTWTHLATDGTPLALSTNSMYQPGGVRLGLVGTFTLRLVPVPEIVSDTNRWFGSDWCVTDSGRISSAEVIGPLVVIL